MESVFDIESFFNYGNPNLKQYKDLNASDPSKDWGCLSLEEKIETKEYLMDKLKDELLIDLGCGSDTDTDIYDIQYPQFASCPRKIFME